MPKNWIKNRLPTRRDVLNTRVLAPFSHLLGDENLWHLNRRSVAGGVATGVFFGFLPIIGQMPLAAATALIGRVNIAVAVTSTLISNPVTMPVLYFACYKIGLLMIGSDKTPQQFAFSTDWVFSNLQPLLLGCISTGLVAAVASYFIVRLLWRLHIVKRWQVRGIKKPWP